MTRTTMTRKTLQRFLLPLLAFLALGAGLQAEEEGTERHIVVGKVRTCPEIKLISGVGEPIHWLGASSRGFLGVELTPLTPELRAHFGVAGDAGVMIGRVVDDSAAAAAGLEVGDIITRIDGEEITSAGRLGRAIRQRQGGESVEIEYWRGGEVYRTTATLQEHERCAVELGHYLHRFDPESLGNLGFELSEEAAEKMREAYDYLGEVDLRDALEGLRTIDWEKHLEGLEKIDLEVLEERMERVRERLEQLERDLEREHERLERLDRDRRREEGDA